MKNLHNWSFSLKTQIIAMTVACFSVLLLSVFWVQKRYIQELRLAQLEKLGELSAASGERQVDELIPGLLLKEEQNALNLLLDRITRQGKLREARFLEPTTALPSKEGCRELSARTVMCISDSENTVTTFHKALLDGQLLGVLRKTKEGPDYSFGEVKRPFLTIIGVLVLSLVGLLGCMVVFLDRVVRAPLMSLEKNLGPALAGTAPLPASTRVKEINSVVLQVRELVLRSQDDRAKALMGEMAAQVAHDIRSPLAAIGVMAEMSPELPEERRIVLRNALQRIRQIADDLLARKGDVRASPISATENSLIADLVFPHLDAIIEEKRWASSDEGVKIALYVGADANNIFAHVDLSEFERVISNLLNNAIEASDPADGHVDVHLSSTPNTVLIAVTDRGIGIAPDLLPQLMEYGVSNKPGGSGLGLYHARARVESWGGSLKIESRINEGTQVTITLPRAKPPSWHVSELRMEPGKPIVIVDDDRTVHQRWRDHLETIRFPSKVHSFFSPQAFVLWHRKQPNLKAHFFVDYTYLGETMTGIDLIEAVGIAEQSVLVTGVVGERALIERCERLAIGLIPKAIFETVPIHLLEVCDGRN